MKFYAYLQNWEIPEAPAAECDDETTVFSDDRSFSSSSGATHYSRSTSGASSAGEEEQEVVKIGAFNRCLATIRGHAGWVSCLALSGDDHEFLLSASQGNDIRAWQHPDLRHRATFGAGNGGGSVKALLALGDGRVVSGHQDRRIRVWKRSTASGNYRLLTTVPTPGDYLSNFALQRNYVQTRRHHRRLWIEHGDAVSCLAAGDGVLYSGSWDATLKVWRLRDFKCVESIRAHDDAVNAVAVGSDGLVYSASADGKVRVWEHRRGCGGHELVATLEGHDSSVNALAVAADGRAVYSGGSDGRVVAWEASALGGAPRAAMRGHRLAVLCLCAVAEVLCSGSADRTVRLWRREAAGGWVHSAVAVLRGHDGPVKCLAASAGVAGGFMVYSGSLDRSIRVWWVSGHTKTPSLLAGGSQLTVEATKLKCLRVYV